MYLGKSQTVDKTNLKNDPLEVLYEYSRRVRLDGVQRNPEVFETESRIPYRAIGDQFYKYKLLVDYFTFGESDLFPSESLKSPELCLLHEIISNTIDPLERGDEAKTCMVTKMPHRM